MYKFLNRFCGVVFLLFLWVGGASAFDVLSGGGEALLSQGNINNGTKELVTNLSLTTNTAVSSEVVTITIPAGGGSLEFSSDPVAITATSGNFAVANLNQSTTQIDFEITGSGTLLVQNIGLYGTNFGGTFLEDRVLNINFQAANFSSDLFRVDTRDFALGFGGGKQLNATHNSSGAAQTLDDLVLVASTALASEVITITPDPAAAFSTQALGALALVKTVEGTTVLDTLDDFADTDIVNVTDGGAIDSDFTVTAVNTVADLETFLDSIVGLSAGFNNTTDVMDLSSVIVDFTVSSDGAMPTLLVGPGTSTTGSINMANTSLASGAVLDTLDQFADTDIISATESDGTVSNFTVTAVNTVADLTSFLLGRNNLSASFDNPNNEIDLVADEDYVISSDGTMPSLTLDFDEAANLQFVPTLPNFVVTSGSLTVANAAITAGSLTFELTGTGQLDIQGLSVFADNMSAKGEFFETRFLNVNALATDFSADLMVIDTIDYGAQVAVSGASGGESNNIFIVGDIMSFSFAPFDYSARFSETSLNLSAFGGDGVADFDDNFTVVADDDDGGFTVPLTVAYTGTNVKAIYNNLNVTLDNQPPTYDFSGHTLLELPAGKTVAGINDIITLRMPPETSGDTLTFTADFSSVGGSLVNFVDAPAVDAQIALEEVAVDNANFNVSVTFADDAGNVLAPQVTNDISVDLIRPVLATANILSITGAPVPGAIGDSFQVALPVDTAAGGGDTLTYDVDLSSIGGSGANFAGSSAAQSFAITAGALNDVAFNQTLTVYDKALNTVSATTNSLQIDNVVPTFNTACGAKFQVNDSGVIDDNKIADITNGEFDGVFFLFPDKAIPGCDLDNFSIDLSLISSTETTFTNQDADGTGRVFALPPGNLDSDVQQFAITVFDVNGNSSSFLTGELKVDNNLATKDQITDHSIPTSLQTPNGAVLEGGTLSVHASITETDIVAVSAEIPGATNPSALIKGSNGDWLGALTIKPGDLIFKPKFISYRLVDDAGNVVILEGGKAFYITNDTTEIKGGGGGSLNFSNIEKKSTLQRFTPSQTKEFHDKNTALKVKSKAQLRLESLKRRMTYPSGTPSRIVHKPESLIDQQRAAWKARQAALEKDGTPKKMQYTLERLALPQESPADIAAARDDAGEFRLRSTLDNLKGVVTNLVKPKSRRKVAPNHRGKYLEIRR